MNNKAIKIFLNYLVYTIDYNITLSLSTSTEMVSLTEVYYF
jgi:hypothetical protein